MMVRRCCRYCLRVEWREGSDVVDVQVFLPPQMDGDRYLYSIVKEKMMISIGDDASVLDAALLMYLSHERQNCCHCLTLLEGRGRFVLVLLLLSGDDSSSLALRWC